MKKGEKRKQDLLKIAYKMFITRGYENTSVDDIIGEAGIAKGTYYYYFESKEQMLEEVIGMMIDEEIVRAQAVLDTDITIPQKIVGIISALRPSEDEQPIEGALMQAENVIMHDKIKKLLTTRAVPLLSEVVKEGIKDGTFDCDMIPERVKMLLIISNGTFDEGEHTAEDVAVFIDAAEKLLGAKSGTMSFIKELIR